MDPLKYITHYSDPTKTQVKKLIDANGLSDHLLSKYPLAHDIKSDKGLYEYTDRLKEEYMRRSQPLSKVIYDGKIHIIDNALGTHTYAKRVQGSKIKRKNEIRVATMFKNVPEEFLRMIIVHELAHFKEKAHDKAFYKLCEHMEPRYHQLEFDTRLYLTQMEFFGRLY